MSRFTTGDIAILNARKSKSDYYGRDGRIAECIKYLGGGIWKVKRPNGKNRKWFTHDMEKTNLTAASL